MTEAERRAAVALSGCRFAPATWDKRFARDMGVRAVEALPAPLTPKQRDNLWRLVHRYRRQLPADVVRLGEATTMDESEWLASSDPAAMLRLVTENPDHANINCNRSPRKLRLFAVACCRQVWEGAPCRTCNGDGFVEVARMMVDADEPLYVPTRREDCPACRGAGKVGGLTDPRSRHAVEVAERYADGLATAVELNQAVNATEIGVIGSVQAAACFLNFHTPERFDQILNNVGEYRDWPEGSPATQAALLRDIFGNPFRPVSLRGPCPNCRHDPCACQNHWERRPVPFLEWNDGLVRRMAENIYQERDFGLMPILGDALLDAGCEDEALMAHCRGQERCPCLGKRCTTQYCWCPKRTPGWGMPHDPPVRCRGDWALDLLTGRA